jgi:hypothetical protein
LVSQSPPWWVHWQLQVHKVWISNSRLIEAQLNDHKPKNVWKWSSWIRELQKPRIGMKAETDKWKCKEKFNTPPNFLDASFPLGRIYYVFHKFLLTTQLAKSSTTLCTFSPPLVMNSSNKTERSRCNTWDQNYGASHIISTNI